MQPHTRDDDNNNNGAESSPSSGSAADNDDEVAVVVGTSLLPNLGALLMMILFRVKGVLLGVMPSSIFTKYPAYLT